jgi:hypothetical protein
MSQLLCVVIPVYNDPPTLLEVFNIRHSMRWLQSVEVMVVHPEGLNLGAYQVLIPGARFLAIDKSYFVSAKSYSRLCLEPFFYKLFIEYEYMLLLQTDALLLRGDLSRWIGSGFDYVGAPLGVSISVAEPALLDGLIPACSGYRRSLPVGTVGNGGFSLRRPRVLLECLLNYSKMAQAFKSGQLPEDIFFSFLAIGSDLLAVPCESVAATFAVEMNAEVYLTHTGEIPMGCHAWHKYDPSFWIEKFRTLGMDVSSLAGIGFEL